jgi:hypothetical protein
MRATRVDNCGRLVIGEYNQAVSEGVVTTTFTPRTIETPEINVPNFAGKRCVYEASSVDLAGYDVTIEFCDVDFEMFEIITKQPLVLDASGRVVGLEIDTAIKLTDGFALETWTGAQGSDACEDPDAEGQWGYLLMPHLKGGIVGDITVANDAVNFTITGAGTREGNYWANGPYAVELDENGVPAALAQAVSRTAALRIEVVSVAPPTELVGARPVLDPALPALTSIAATEDAGDVTGMTADFATTPAATGPVWWDFGDGDWDLVVAPGAASHQYTDPGTYTVRASQNGIAWPTTTVVVPFP